jgi:hypothetical protein
VDWRHRLQHLLLREHRRLLLLLPLLLLRAVVKLGRGNTSGDATCASNAVVTAASAHEGNAVISRWSWCFFWIFLWLAVAVVE